MADEMVCEASRLIPEFESPSIVQADLGSTLAIADWLSALRKGWFITDSQVIAGMRWRTDWLAHALAKQSYKKGYICLSQDAVDAAGLWLADVRAVFGIATEQWLVMFLIRNLAMPRLTEILYPDLPELAGRHAVLNTFVFVMEQLTGRYEWLDAQRAA